jgi:hypothetical protein
VGSNPTVSTMFNVLTVVLVGIAVGTFATLVKLSWLETMLLAFICANVIFTVRYW